VAAAVVLALVLLLIKQGFKLLKALLIPALVAFAAAATFFILAYRKGW